MHDVYCVLVYYVHVHVHVHVNVSGRWTRCMGHCGLLEIPARPGRHDQNLVGGGAAFIV